MCVCVCVCFNSRVGVKCQRASAEVQGEFMVNVCPRDMYLNQSHSSHLQVTGGEERPQGEER